MGIEALLSTQIIDTTAVGRSVMTAVDAAAARTAIGAGVGDVLTGGSYANPSWITSLAWSKISTTPTTLAGYGITDGITAAAVASGYQPLDADLTALAALTGTNNIYYRSAADTWSSVTIGSGLSFTGGTLSATSSGGITSLNGLTGATQTFAVATTGTDFAITSSGTAHTFSIPDASATARGLITTGTQTIAGAKTLSGAATFSAAGTALSVTNNVQVSGNTTTYRLYSNSQRITIFNHIICGGGFGIHFNSTTGQDTGDTAIVRGSAAGVVAIRLSTTAHTLQVNNTYTSDTSFERVSLGWSGNICTLETQAGSGGGTLRGLKIGSASSSLIGLWGVTPIVQPTTSVASATRVGGGGTALTDTDTFDGYTLSQIVKALRNIGALA